MNRQATKTTVIVQIVQHLSPGGIETMSLDLQQFRHEDSVVHIVSLEGNAQKMIAAWPRLGNFSKHLHFMEKAPGVKPALVVNLARLLRKLRATVVHTHHIGPLLYGGLAAKMAGVSRIIHTEHDGWHLSNTKNRRIMSACVRMLNPLLVADADMVAESLRDLVPNAFPRVIHNGIDTQRFSPGDMAGARKKLQLPEDVYLVGCAARMHEVKGHENLLNALFRVPGHVHLALAGNGPTEQALRQQVIDLDLHDRVHFLGLVEDMPTFYRAINLFCLASKAEGMPLSPLEAQSCGTRALLTDVGGCKETLCPASGMLVKPDDSSALTDAITKLSSESAHSSPREFVVACRDVRQMVVAYSQLMQLAG